MVPTQPKFFDMPFAQNGGRNTIPASGDEEDGNATLDQGFPIITEQPLSQGGIPPRRKDFNGILYALSNFCFFAQSGGVFTYDAALDYRSPAIVWYNNNFWICIKANGPDSTVVAPGTDSNYWKDFIGFLGLGSDGNIVANRLGTSTVGSGTKHIYLDSGSPKASSSTVGSTAQGMWLNAGTMTAMSATIGNSTTPAWCDNGVWKACSRSIPEGSSSSAANICVAVYTGGSGSGTSQTMLYETVSGTFTPTNNTIVIACGQSDFGTNGGRYINIDGTGSYSISNSYYQSYEMGGDPAILRFYNSRFYIGGTRGVFLDNGGGGGGE